MKIDSNFASLHAYLCGDGYVLFSKNPKYSYYYVGLRNTNINLLKDFQNKCQKVFGLVPIITKQKDRCKFQNKEICMSLLEKFGSFHSSKWTLPILSKNNLASWLRSYFDCDGWVSLVWRKNRQIGLDSINENGLLKIQESLKIFGINSSVRLIKERNIWNLSICGKDDLVKFQKYINFFHPKKRMKLIDAINSYVSYEWEIPEDHKGFIKFVKGKGRISLERNQVRFNSKIKLNLKNLQNKMSSFEIKSKLNGPWTNPYGSKWYCLSINLKELNKLRGGER